MYTECKGKKTNSKKTYHVLETGSVTILFPNSLKNQGVERIVFHRQKEEEGKYILQKLTKVFSEFDFKRLREIYFYVVSCNGSITTMA